MTLAVILKLIKDHYRIAILGILIALVLFLAAFQYYCGESRTEKNIDARTGKIVDANIAANQTAINANVAVKEAANVEAQANKIRNSNVANVQLDKAIQDLCKAYPQSELCGVKK